MKSVVSLHQQKKQNNSKTLNIMKVTFSCSPDEGEKLKKVVSEHKLAELVSEFFTGKYSLINFEFKYFDLNKLIVISEYLGIYPNMPYFFVG